MMAEQAETCCAMDGVHRDIQLDTIRSFSNVTIQGCCVTYRRGLDWTIGFIVTLCTPLGTTGRCSSIAVHRCTRTRFLSLHSSNPGNGFTTVSQSLKSHMKSSFHSLIHSLPFLLNHLPLPTLSILFLCSQPHTPAGWCLETRLTLLYNNFARTTQKTQPLYCWESRCIAPDVLCCCLRIRCRGNVFTESLPSNERIFWLHYSGFRESYHNNLKFWILKS
jgi:hypothetical protein